MTQLASYYYDSSVDGNFRVTNTVNLVSQSIPNNTSLVNFVCTIQCMAGTGYHIDASSGHVKINNVTTGKSAPALYNSDSYTINNSNVTIYHNSSGDADNIWFGSDWSAYVHGVGHNGVESGSSSFSVDLPSTATVPTVTSSAATSITNSSAVGSGNVTFGGNNPITSRGVCWGTSANPNVGGPHDTTSGTIGAFSANMSGLSPLTTYHFRMYAHNGVSTGYSQDRTFTTTGAPILTSSAATSIDLTSATANGNVTSGAGITERGFVWSTSINPTTTDTKVIVVGTTGAYSGSITSLTQGVTYHYRPYAINSIGTGYGADRSFVTLKYAAVTSSAATNVLTTSITANGNLTDAGNPVITEKGFVWASGANPTTSNTKVIVSGSTTGAYTGTISGLAVNTGYHYRAYAINSTGTFYGADEAFTTDISYFTDPTNAYSSNDLYATAGSDSGVLSVKISKDGGTTWSAPKANTYTVSEGYQTYGSATDTWGLSMTGADINSATNFVVRITSGTTNLHSQDYKGFGYSETAGSTVMGLRVQIEAKYDNATMLVDHIRVIPTMSTSDANIIEGSTAYDSTLNTLTAFNGTTWDALPTLQMIYPVGCIYTTTVSTNPATVFGFGTWAAAGAGQVLVGKAAAGTFSTAGATGGAETVAGAAHAHGVGAATAEIAWGSGSTNMVLGRKSCDAWTANYQIATTGAASTASQSVGAKIIGTTDGTTPGATSVLQPYLVVYFWERTA